MIEVVSSIEEVNDVDCSSIKNQCADDISYKYFKICLEMRVKEYKYKQHQINQSYNYEIMNVYIVIEFSLFNTEEWFFDYKVYHVGYIDKDQQDDLDNWVVKRKS